MEFSPLGAIPYISRVDAGTVDAVRALGANVVSSGDLVQRFEAVWNDAALETHRDASARLYRIKDRAFALIADRLESRAPIHEFEIQQAMVGWFEEEGLVTDCPPVVAAGESGGNPHYLPTASQTRPIRSGDPVLIDLWGKLETSGAVFADITWMAYAGADVPDEYATAFRVAASARDAATTLVREAASTRRELRGWEVDRAARDVIESAGLGRHFVHRTGHSLGEAVHGNGVHMDDYETHDDRRLLPGTGFTIEPGLYFKTFGIRTEINMFVGADDATVTGPVQTEITPLG
jgi:Xaa-Pro aminopeptidase